MNREEKIREEVENTLNAPEKMAELEANPYLFTRLQSEIANQKTGKGNHLNISRGILRPAALFLFVLLNVFTSFYIIDSSAKSTTAVSTSRQTYLSAISSEYNLNHTYNSKLNKLMGE